MIETASRYLQGRESTSTKIGRKGAADFVTRTFGALPDRSQLASKAPSSIQIDSSIADAAVAVRRFRVLWSPPAPKMAGDEYELREKFDGVVLTVGQNSFEARLFPSEVEDEPLEAEFSNDDLSVNDRALLEPGAMFVLTIGYRTTGSSRRRESSFYLRRMPAMTDEQASQAVARATAYSNDVQWK